MTRVEVKSSLANSRQRDRKS